MTLRYMSTRRTFGLAILLAIAVFAILGPLLIARDPATQNLSATLQPPSLSEPLGTDQFGRSMLARLAQAAGVSFGLALLVVVTAAVPGALLGVVVAWRGGWIERAAAVVADGILAIPGLLLVVLLVSFAPGEFWLLYLAIALTLWVEYFRVVRVTSRQVLGGSPVQASRLLGFGAGYILRRHVVPAIAPLVFTLMTFGAATAVLAVAGLGYIKIGLQPPTAELGQMMAEAFPLYFIAPWLIAAPIALLALGVLGLALLTSSEPAR